jgi:outer membrane protein OmpA-like peptidoglycan-associated protein
MPEHPISPSSPAMPASNVRSAISARQCACALFCGLALALAAPSASAEEVTLNFGFDSAVLSAQARGELDRIAAVLTDPNIEGYSISIDGHTDGVGSSQYNQALSERRAEAARQYFITRHGIDPSRLIARGHGKAKPLAAAAPASKANRRVQLVIFDTASRTRMAAAQKAAAGGPG